MTGVQTCALPISGDEHPSFMQQLIDLRQSHYIHQNEMFNIVMKDILSRARANPDNSFQNLKDTLRAQVSDTPEKREYTVTYTIDMSAFLQQDDPIALWYRDTDRCGNVRTSYINVSTLVALDKPVLTRYMLHTDPQVQQLRTMLRSEFPEARIVPKMEYQHYNVLNMHINIIYTLPPLDKSKITIHTIPQKEIVSNEW